jgi:hypothetical protein
MLCFGILRSVVCRHIPKFCRTLPHPYAEYQTEVFISVTFIKAVLFNYVVILSVFFSARSQNIAKATVNFVMVMRF